MGSIIVENVGKKYKRYRNKSSRLLEWVIGGKRSFHEETWVLRGISLRVDPGESLGVIGQNGAGKSTLLKLLTGTTQPSTGNISVDGRISALLELGMGFHPDFTGRQNVYMQGRLMGLNDRDIDELMPEIEAFAEIGPYMDQPLRTYSSGMTVRVAFSVATAVRPEILIVDEALSVGDIYFQHKCFDRIRKFKEEGTTLLFVSHDMGAVKNLCDRAVLLDQGLLVREGKPEEVLDYYNAVIAKKEANYEIQQSQGSGQRLSTRSGDGKVEILDVSISQDGNPANAVQVGEKIEIAVSFKCLSDVYNPTVGIVLKDRLGNEIYGTNTFHQQLDLGLCKSGEEYRIVFELEANLGVGHYSLTAAVHDGIAHLNGNYDWWDHAATIQIIPGNQPIFVGVCYLPVAVKK